MEDIMSSHITNEFKLVNPRPTVEIYLPDGRVMSGPRNAPIGDFLNSLPESSDVPILGAIVNGELRELTFPISMDSNVIPISMRDADGMRIYRRSLVFLLEAAFDQYYNSSDLRVEHSISSGGYFCRVISRPPLSQGELKELDAEMRSLVEQDIPFRREEIPIKEAIEYFEKNGKTDKAHLLLHRKKDYLTVYKMNGFCDYHHGYMVPSTGYLKWFRLTLTGEGFTLHFPLRRSPTQLLPLSEYPKLLHTFRLYKSWLDRLEISSVGALNDAIIENQIDEVILVSEALHEQRISEIASQISAKKGEIRVIMVAGPTSSGKTTFSKRLAIQLLASGVAPFPLAIDDYFIARAQTPLDENGEPDFESIVAVDRKRLSHDLQQLIRGERVRIPSFNFITGESEEGREVQLKSGEIIILEGIHGLNPELIPQFPTAQTFRIYISALTQLNLDRHNRISTTDTRLIRRIVRDARERGYSAQDTIQRWESVRRGEKRHIFPYQENCDLMFNSALVYELSALKPLAEPLLRQVPHGTPEHVEAKRLLSLLEWVLPLESDLIPDNSILREFIGGSILSSFTLWQSKP
jgi:uridine kinase